MARTDFGSIVKSDIVAPLLELCDLLSEEGAYQEFAFFSNLLVMLSDPEDEARVLEAVIELSRCAFLGFQYSDVAAQQIDALLARAITLSHTMSAPGDSH